MMFTNTAFIDGIECNTVVASFVPILSMRYISL